MIQHAGYRRHSSVPRHVLALILVTLILSLSGSARAATTAAASPITTATTFIARLAAGDFSAAERAFSTAMRAAAPAATLRQIWTQLLGHLGAFQRQGAATVQPVNGGQNVIVHCVFAKDTADLIITTLTDGTIGGFHISTIEPVMPTAYTPPSYVHVASFHERAVTIGTAPWTLPGTLTLPSGPGPFPAVVLVAGSGPADRDETIGADKPFRDLAWGLASQGIAVLRYDKRTLVYSRRMAGLATFTVQDEFVDDAVAALRLLARTPRIAPQRIYVLGHSEGGMMAPQIAQQETHVAGVIILAGPTRPLPDVILGQYTYLASRGLATAAQVATVKQQVAAIKALIPASNAHHGTLLGAPPAYWLSLRPYRPAAVARALAKPLLIMQAGRDYQVTLADFNGWKAALAGRGDVTLKLYSALFHPFMPLPPSSPAGLATPNAYTSPGHVAREVVTDIATWLKAQA